MFNSKKLKFVETASAKGLKLGDYAIL